MPVLFPRSTAVPCSLLPELESVLWAAATFGAALGKHPNISVTIPAMDDCTLPCQWSQMNLAAFKKQWQNSLHFSSFRRILRNPVVLSYLFPSPTSLLSAWDCNGFFTAFSPRACALSLHGGVSVWTGDTNNILLSPVWESMSDPPCSKTLDD